jgi:hypothetical protein
MQCNATRTQPRRWDANELERVQLREAVLKHKAELEAFGEEHAAELASLTTTYEAEAAAAARAQQELTARLEASEQQLAAAQV